MGMLLAILLSAAPQDGLRVTTDRTVDTSSLESIVRDVVRLSGAKTNDEKAIAIYEWLHETIFHHAYPVEKSPQSVGPLKVLKVYGWGLCGGQHTVLKALFETAGWPVRYRGWSDPGHTTIEVQYDGRWHYFDVFLKCYFWTQDRKTVAGQDDIVADPSIVLDAAKDGRVPANSYLCCGDDAPGIVKGCRNSKAHAPSKPADGWASVTGRDQGWSPSLRLPAGATLRLEWAGKPGAVAVDGRAAHSCGNKDFRSDPALGPLHEHYGPRTHSNGRFTYAPDFSRAADAADVALSSAAPRGGKLVASGAGRAVFKLALPYPYVDGRIDAAFEGGEGSLAVSTDGGKTWAPAATGELGPLLRQKYDVQVKAEFSGALASFRFEGTVEHNRYALPRLLTGANQVTVAADALPAGRAVAVTYAWQEATAPEMRKRWDGQGLSYGAEKTATRTLSGPSETFKVDVGGNTPPRMLWLELSSAGK
jgi:hypothetical protein